MEIKPNDQQHPVQQFSLCQIDQATLTCGLRHFQENPNPEITREFEPYLSNTKADIDHLINRLNHGGVSEVAQETMRAPVLCIASNLVDSTEWTATVLLPDDYDGPRLFRVAIEASQMPDLVDEACQSVIRSLQDDVDQGQLLPTVDQLQVVSVDRAVETFGNRFCLLWKRGDQQRIHVGYEFSDVVDVVPSSEFDGGWLKVVTLVRPDDSIGRYVARGDSDAESIDQVIAWLTENETRGYSDYSWRENVVFIDPVVQNDDRVYVVQE